MRRVLLVLSAASVLVLASHVQVNLYSDPPRRISDILEEIDRRVQHDPPPACPALYTLPTVSEIKGACPAFQPWSDDAVLYYARITRRIQ